MPPSVESDSDTYKSYDWSWQVGIDDQYVVPWGLREILSWMKSKSRTTDTTINTVDTREC